MSPHVHPSDDQLDAATWCRHLVPDGSVYAFLADHRHVLFPPELFADLARQGGGHPSVPAEVVATVMVLQALEGLSDREAVSALRRDIAWKVACGLRLDDEGFHRRPRGRHARKTSAHKRDGYKAQIAAEPESGLVTQCADRRQRRGRADRGRVARR
jgi:hypothetical protein